MLRSVDDKMIRGPQETTALQLERCPCCSRILCRQRLAPGSVVEIKCGSCNTMTVIRTAEQAALLR
jgi:hypothetical protein